VVCLAGSAGKRGRTCRKIACTWKAIEIMRSSRGEKARDRARNETLTDSEGESSSLYSRSKVITSKNISISAISVGYSIYCTDCRYGTCMHKYILCIQ
jgi:hypothetical protein